MALLKVIGIGKDISITDVTKKLSEMGYYTKVIDDSHIDVSCGSTNTDMTDGTMVLSDLSNFFEYLPITSIDDIPEFEVYKQPKQKHKPIKSTVPKQRNKSFVSKPIQCKGFRGKR